MSENPSKRSKLNHPNALYSGSDSYKKEMLKNVTIRCLQNLKDYSSCETLCPSGPHVTRSNEQLEPIINTLEQVIALTENFNGCDAFISANIIYPIRSIESPAGLMYVDQSFNVFEFLNSNFPHIALRPFTDEPEDEKTRERLVVATLAILCNIATFGNNFGNLDDNQYDRAHQVFGQILLETEEMMTQFCGSARIIALACGFHYTYLSNLRDDLESDLKQLQDVIVGNGRFNIISEAAQAMRKFPDNEEVHVNICLLLSYMATGHSDMVELDNKYQHTHFYPAGSGGVWLYKDDIEKVHDLLKAAVARGVGVSNEIFLASKRFPNSMLIHDVALVFAPHRTVLDHLGIHASGAGHD